MKRPRFLIIAIVLTVLDVAMAFSCGWPVWIARSSDVWNRGFAALLAALGATSLANVWAQVVPTQNVRSDGQNDNSWRSAAPGPVEARGQADV